VITCSAVEGVGEVRPGDDLAGLLLDATDLRDGDVLVVTSKVVSKAEGRVVVGSRDELLTQETDRVVARRGATAIVRTRLGLVMAAAGIDASNTEPGTLVLLPLDPDGSARRLREEVAARAGANVAVLLSDTFGRPWRAGQTDIAVGAAGLDPLDDLAGHDDGYGNLLAVTAPALADEITAAADLATGKLARCPAAVVRGLEWLVLAPAEHGPGAAALVRSEEEDLFGLGAREAVVHALLRIEGRGFGAPVDPEELVALLQQVLPGTSVTASQDGSRVEAELGGGADERRRGALEERVTSAAFALGWVRAPATSDGAVTLLPVTP
jgi:coenzyme F420-0:L-glutamate ligase/coenzyme F420-1:gamma-L-glutamate ligase